MPFFPHNLLASPFYDTDTGGSIQMVKEGPTGIFPVFQRDSTRLVPLSYFPKEYFVLLQLSLLILMPI